MNKLIQPRRRRLLTGLLIMTILCSSFVGPAVPMTVMAGTLTSNKENLLDGAPFSFYGKEHRTSMFHWGHGDGVSREQSAFCIAPEKEMYTGMVMSDQVYGIGDDFGDVGIDSVEQFQNICMILQWSGAYQGKGKVEQGKYIVAQGALFAVMTGHALDGEFRWEMQKLKARIKNRTYRAAFDGELDDLIRYLQGDTGRNPLPEGIAVNREMAPVQRMQPEADGYSLSFDISGCPELKSVTWKYPEGSWSQKVTGNTLTFFYRGGEEPSGMISGSNLPPALQAKIPKEGEIHVLQPNYEFEQTLVTGFVPSDGGLYIRVNHVGATPDGPTFEIKRHSETFEANYNISLEKLDAETGQPLEHAVFEVLEAFDENQLGGLLQRRNMYPAPAVWSGQRVCGTMTTDLNGKADHRDTRYYDYSKTYCTGHPEPEYQEAPEEETDPVTGEVVNGEEIQAVEQENLRLAELWEEGIEACEEEVDFHDVHGDGERMMIDDRDDTYDAFIHLEYVYSVREIRARQGYILHGTHPDDKAIEVITTNASEAGASRSRSDQQKQGNMGAEEGECMRTRLFGLLPQWEQKLIPVASPPSAAEAISLDDARRVEWTREEYKEKDASPSDGRRATDSDAEEKTEVTYRSMLMEYFRGLFANTEKQVYGGVTLPEPEEDGVASIGPGERGRCSHIFQVENHRTEGEIHINKRDLELYEKDSEDSYGKTQGDGTLEGAVYGLYAADDLVHPDGKTGTVFERNALVATGATDVNGDAAFVTITKEGTDPSSAGGTGSWLGHPLLLGSYYIREISRSEGYERSVFGVNLTETNRNASGVQIMEDSGSAQASELSHRRNEWDGSWNDFTVKSFQTVNGYDVTLSGYPEESRIYKVNSVLEEVTQEVITGSYMAAKTDGEGNPVYRKALGGEYRLDRQGNQILSLDENGGLQPDLTRPITEKLSISYRLNLYPQGSATWEMDPDEWGEATESDAEYVKTEANSMLGQLGYRLLDETDGGGAPWIEVELSGTTSEELILEILDWYTLHNFWDSAGVESVWEEEGAYRVRLFVDYQALQADGIYDSASGALYRRQDIQVDGGAEESHGWIVYEPGEFVLNGRNAVIKEKREFIEPVPFGANLDEFLVSRFEPLYETYEPGDIILDADQTPIPETEMKFIYETRTYMVETEHLEPVDAVYDGAMGTYRFHVPNSIDWTITTQPEETLYRAAAPQRTIVHQGVEMRYGDYLLEVAGCGAGAVPTKVPADAGSYIKSVDLTYPGQMVVVQDGGTASHPIIVLQRIIKQAIRVTKDIAQDSYDDVNTYRIHRDPFTVLFGGYQGKPGAKTMKDFHFRLYRRETLIETGLLKQQENGTYDYERLMREYPELIRTLALPWDIPEFDQDHDLTTVHADQGTGIDDYYGNSIPLPYGTYVLMEQQPVTIPNKHYQVDQPQEIVLPFIPQIEEDGTIHENVPSSDYLYDSQMTPEEQVEKFGIRFCEESDVLQSHRHSGDGFIYPYGLCSRLHPAGYTGSRSEEAGMMDSVYYEILYHKDGSVKDYGVTLQNVDTMKGVSTAVDGKFCPALVPWSVLSPVDGGAGHRQPGTDEDGNYNYIGYAGADMENRFYSSKIRIEKLDVETGENIIHGEALFRIYAAKRDISGAGSTGVEGSGTVLYKKETMTGTRDYLEELGYVDEIRWDPEAKTYRGTALIPDYDESEMICMMDDTGNEVGIFKAYSTVKEVVGEDGKIEKIPVGYLETYQPLGAGVYVLVEIQAPDGYQRSRPVAFEVYSDHVDYYEDGRPDNPIRAEKFQYAIPIAGEENKYQTTEVNQIKMKDPPSIAEIHKVESGDQSVGDENGVDDLLGVNDKGDVLTYQVRGRREYLEARSDVDQITWDPDAGDYVGTVTKTYDEWSERLIRATEEELEEMGQAKPLYEIETGAFTGFGIRFDVYVKDSTLTLYDGLEVVPVMDHVYRGVTVKWSQDQVVGIKAEATGTHLEIITTEKDTKPPYPDIWDAQAVDNEAVSLFFYDLDLVKTQTDARTGELWVLDEAGNPTCYADSISGMAYVYDEYGTMIVYKADEGGQKMVSKSIKTHSKGDEATLYPNKESVLDEQGLPIYDKNVQMNWQEESWVTPEMGSHRIQRLPFGAYILEETEVPYGDGYIKAVNQGIVLKQTSRVQHYYLQNEFTKINIAKIDVSSGEEIQDAAMTLYDGNGRVYAEWISGYQYDDDGQLKVIRGQEKVATTQPHWIDHIPVGEYVLEETRVPYEWGYVQSQPVKIPVLETGHVQTFVMEDDYTSVDVKKYDTKTGEALKRDEPAVLSLYHAVLDEDGKPKTELGEKIVTWKTGDGERLVTLPVTKAIRQAQYYLTESETTRFEYLPVGFYVLVEEHTPSGYATANPILITVADVGHQERVQTYEMGDVPLTVEIWKTGVAGGAGQLRNAALAIYRVVDGKPEAEPLYRWISGTDGSDEAGALKPHRIEYIPAGDYILVEEEVPYGFLKAEEIPFTIRDTPEVQHVEMADEIPKGILTIAKHDAEQEEILLNGAEFEFWCLDTGELIETMVTGEDGKATASNAVPIGYMNRDGIFTPYTYAVEEVDAPDNYMLNTGRFEFQFSYEGESTPLVRLTYDAVNRLNQVKISKQILTTKEELPGAELMVTGKYTKILLDRWISTSQPHYISDIPPGTYLLTEISTPGGGYAKAEPMEFTIEDNMVLVPHITMFDQPTQVQVDKTEGNGTTLLAGAKLQLSKPDGTVIAEWVTETNGQMLYGLEPGEYVVTELVVPHGYRKGEPMKILVKETMELQKFIYRNYKLSTDGGEPEIEKPEKPGNPPPVTGIITARYEWSVGSWTDWFPGSGLPKLGDSGLGSGIALAVLLLSVGALVRICRTVAGKKRGKGLWVLLFLCLLCFGDTQTVWASPEGTQTILVTSDPCRTKEELQVPEPCYTDEAGVEYQLEEWQMEVVEVPEEQREAERERAYFGLEAKAEIPETEEIFFSDPGSGYQITQSYPIKSKEISNEAWADGFEFTVTFHTYGAEFYELMEHKIPYEDETPGLAGYETALLQMIGLSDSDYQVDQVVWNGAAYTDESGILCRDALAVGRKKIRDYQVVYGGSVTIPPQTLYQVAAVYRIAEHEAPETTISASPAESLVPAQEAEPEPVEPAFWNIWRSTLVVTIALSSLVLLVTLLFMGYRRFTARRKEKKNL